MGMTLEKLTHKRGGVAGGVDGETIFVGYNSRIRSAQFLAKIEAIGQGASVAEQVDATADALADVLLDWDVLLAQPAEGEAPEHYPTDKAALLPLDLEFLQAVL